jgi:phenylpropionate dioxygenase-like ring-hydroxylating dioxygenase large terminal subunit
MGHLLSNVDPALRRCWHPVARPAEVTAQPRRVMLLGEPWVIYRAAGRMVAFADRCPHRRTPLSLGRCEADVLACAYHGWRFDDRGTCIEIPALGPGAPVPPAARLSPPAGLVEAHGMVFLAPEEPIAPLVDRTGWSFTMSYEHSFANREDPGVAAGIRPLVQTRRLAYRLTAPFHLRLRIDFVEAGGTNVIGFFIQPESADSCRLFTTLWRDDLSGDAVRMAEAVDFEVAVLREDLLIQEAFDELVLPLARTAEVHTRADRTTLELRRVLADLVDAAGG